MQLEERFLSRSFAKSKESGRDGNPDETFRTSINVTLLELLFKETRIGIVVDVSWFSDLL